MWLYVPAAVLGLAAYHPFRLSDPWGAHGRYTDPQGRWWRLRAWSLLVLGVAMTAASMMLFSVA